MGVIIDTSILIKYEKGKIDLPQVISGREQEEFFLSIITVSELLHGVWRATNTAIRTKRSIFVEGVLSHFSILSIDLSIARAHSQLWAELQSQGKMIGVHDSWIAATCMAKGLQLITSNIREFERVPGMVVESW